MRSPPVTRLKLMPDTIGPIARGHPWVYQDGIQGKLPTPGTLVELIDPKDASIAWGICDNGVIAIRILGRTPAPLAEHLAERLKIALGLRRMIGKETTCYRLWNGEGDQVPGLIVDRYGEVLVLKNYAHAWEPHLEAIVSVLKGVPGIKTIYRRFGVDRVDNRDGGELLWGEDPPETLVVTEHGVKLLVRVKTGQKTGLFLDQREHRKLVRGWSKGLTVTNLFSYNGGFSVYAALGGAKHVTSVDQSAPALDDAREIFRLNGLDPNAHAFEVADIFAWEGEKVDFLICDPPSLAHAREDEARARKAYKDLHRRISKLPRKFLATSSCTARLSWERWEETIREGLGNRGWVSLHRSAESLDHPVAHPEGRYLKFLLLGRTLG